MPGSVNTITSSICSGFRYVRGNRSPLKTLVDARKRARRHGAVATIAIRPELPAGAFVGDPDQVISVFTLWQPLDHRAQLRLIDEAHSESDFLQARHFQTLAVLDRGYVICRLQQTGLCAGV